MESLNEMIDPTLKAFLEKAEKAGIRPIDFTQFLKGISKNYEPVINAFTSWRMGSTPLEDAEKVFGEMLIHPRVYRKLGIKLNDAKLKQIPPIPWVKDEWYPHHPMSVRNFKRGNMEDVTIIFYGLEEFNDILCAKKQRNKLMPFLRGDGWDEIHSLEERWYQISTSGLYPLDTLEMARHTLPVTGGSYHQADTVVLAAAAALYYLDRKSFLFRAPSYTERPEIVGNKFSSPELRSLEYHGEIEERSIYRTNEHYTLSNSPPTVLAYSRILKS